ncbi:Cof-type HAD-IIB family hydrolase [Rummeliibacillus sp. NPDC094406]|uniref:Cof-type HAD-IIB family hydrolase n=1 Tax=Rummeliibacillus sp. NPDC094406 TaxID=3364511 RepID=UPI003822DBF8
MKKKILFFDIDGTLYDSEKKLPKSTYDAIQQAKENGHEVAIATGRSPFFLKPVLDELGLNSYISFNGQYVVYQGHVISKRSIPIKTVERLVAQATRENSPIVYLDHLKMTSATKDNQKVRVSMDSLFYPMPEVNEEYYKHSDTYQILLYVDEEEEKQYATLYPELKLIRWHEYSVDVINHDVSKAYGIKQFLNHTDFDITDAIAFGDGLNDIEMLKAVGTSVAMGNGHEKAKEVATFVTDHVDDDGLSKAMRKLGLC